MSTKFSSIRALWSTLTGPQFTYMDTLLSGLASFFHNFRLLRSLPEQWNHLPKSPPATMHTPDHPRWAMEEAGKDKLGQKDSHGPVLPWTSRRWDAPKCSTTDWLSKMSLLTHRRKQGKTISLSGTGACQFTRRCAKQISPTSRIGKRYGPIVRSWAQKAVRFSGKTGLECRNPGTGRIDHGQASSKTTL